MKTVKVEIATNDLEILKQSAYNLCFAKKVNSSFNVAWQVYRNFLLVNQFSWQPQYELFGNNTFQNGVVVNPVTNTQSCDLGNSCTLNQYGVLEKQVSGGPDTSLTFINDYGPIHTGVSQMSTGIEGQTTMNPIYVSENQIVIGQATLTPKDEVMVWFQQDIETGTMDSSLNSTEATSRYIILDLTKTNQITCRYENGEWKIV